MVNEIGIWTIGFRIDSFTKCSVELKIRVDLL